MAGNKRYERTGSVAASKASKVLSDPHASPREKSAAASALSQVGRQAVTHQKAASAAGKDLRDPHSSARERSAAASALAQTPNKKKR
jgi:hypothetical protein